MEVEEIQTQPPCKFSRVSNNGSTTDSPKLAQKGSPTCPASDQQHHNDEEESELIRRPNLRTGTTAPGGDGGAANRLRGWHHSSRIIRVARASGGKDRHSKVWTSKGLRDRRVRLSVTTAIQFYDLQDRLGYDQPSKAVEWLIKAAADAINELPSLNGSFPDSPKQLSDEKRTSEGTEQGFDSADVELEDPNFTQNQNQHLSLWKSACSSTSDTSKGSGLSLLRSDIRVNRVKAREQARERAAKKKENDSRSIAHQQNINNPISQSSTFTELLTGGISSASNNNNNNNNPAAAANSSSGSEVNLFHHKAAAARQWPLIPMDYFGGPGLLGPNSSRTTNHSTGFTGQIQLGNTLSQAMTMFNFSGENHHQEQQHYPYVSDHLIPVATANSSCPGGDYNLNFTISPGLSGFNRGTLQSNSSSQSLLLPHIQRFSSSSQIDPSTNVPFFIGAATPPPPTPPPPPLENHHHYHQFPPALHLYGAGSRHSDQKGKGKN